MDPIIKYVGGKRREIPIFHKWLEVDFDTYVEPFVGGGAVYFHLEPQKAIINDFNKKLILFYREVANNREGLISELLQMKNEEEFYYRIRKMFNDEIEKEFSDAAIFAYINRMAYSGLVRYSKGKKNPDGTWLVKPRFNVPYGRYKTTMEKIASFITEEASQLLQRTLILNEDFEEVFNRIKDIENPFIFLDPPYISTFHHYNGSDGFTIEDHERLAKCFKEIHGKCLLIINDHPIVRELYADYIKDSYDKNYAINVKNRMKDVTEARHLIIANYDI